MTPRVDLFGRVEMSRVRCEAAVKSLSCRCELYDNNDNDNDNDNDNNDNNDDDDWRCH